jgi:hypothetical protein
LTLINATPAFSKKNADIDHFATVTDHSQWTFCNVDGESVDIDGKTTIHLICQGDLANGIVGLALPVRQKFPTGAIEAKLLRNIMKLATTTEILQHSIHSLSGELYG